MTPREKIIQRVYTASSAIHDATQWEDPYYAIDGKTIMDDLVEGILADLGIKSEPLPEGEVVA